MRIIPAIDIIDGKCVRLTRGDYSQQKTYNTNPVEVAKIFQDQGIEYLHVVDLEGAKAQRIINYKMLEALASKTQLKVDFGGGIKSREDVKIAFDAGAQQITVGSIAAQNQELMLEWLNEFGAERIILGADCKNRKIATNGWQNSTEWDVVPFIQEDEKRGITYSIVTDIDKDGMLEGPSVDLYRDILAQTQVRLIASGGVTTMTDVLKLKDMGCEGVIIGKALYEGTIKLEQLRTLW